MLNLRKKQLVRELSRIFDEVSVADKHGNVFCMQNGKVITKKTKDPDTLEKISLCLDKRTSSTNIQCFDGFFKQCFSKVVPLGKESVVVSFSSTIEHATAENLSSKNNVAHVVMEHDTRLYTDSLTGVYNKLYLSNSFDNKKINAVAMIDVDDFKKINDSFGHLVGDKILKNIAEVIKLSAAEYGKVVRFGGDEFVVVFENVDKTVLQKIINSISTNVGKIEIKNFSVSVSIGAVYGNGKIGALIDRADKAMYELKKQKK